MESESGMNFKLSENETASANDFLVKLPKKYVLNNPITLIFDNCSGIGFSVKIKVGDKEKDITDYGRW